MNDVSNIDPRLPLIDLHRHLDGSVRLETILEIGRQYDLPLPAWDIDGLRPHVQIVDPQPGVMAFIGKFHWMTQILVDYDACRRIAYENVEDAAVEGLDYIELRFSPWFMSQAHGLKPEGVVEAVCDGVAAGERDFGLRANLLGILSRTYGVQACLHELESLFSQRQKFVGLDLAGDEANFPAALFVEHFRQAREAGWQITAHAGESAGAMSIWQAVRQLGAKRIGHGVAALQDDALLAYLTEQRIGVECNLTSNVQTSTVPDYQSHPIRRFLELNILASLNTDDPGISAIDLPYEYNVAAPAAGLTIDQIHQAQRNALETSFLSDVEKMQLLAKKRVI